VIDCFAGRGKHDLAEEHLTKTKITLGLFLVLIGRAQAPVWDVNPSHHIERKKPMPSKQILGRSAPGQDIRQVCSPAFILT
jgi:hypothetical protein